HFLRPRTPSRRYSSENGAAGALRDSRVDVIVVPRSNAGALLARHCRLASVGLLPPDRFYGMSFPPGSRLQPLVVRALVRLQRSGTFDTLVIGTIGRLPPVRSLR